jgi:hypothetical protein
MNVSLGSKEMNTMFAKISTSAVIVELIRDEDAGARMVGSTVPVGCHKFVTVCPLAISELHPSHPHTLYDLYSTVS